MYTEHFSTCSEKMSRISDLATRIRTPEVNANATNVSVPDPTRAQDIRAWFARSAMTTPRLPKPISTDGLHSRKQVDGGSSLIREARVTEVLFSPVSLASTRESFRLHKTLVSSPGLRKRVLFGSLLRKNVSIFETISS